MSLLSGSLMLRSSTAVMSYIGTRGKVCHSELDEHATARIPGKRGAIVKNVPMSVLKTLLDTKKLRYDATESGPMTHVYAPANRRM